MAASFCVLNRTKPQTVTKKNIIFCPDSKGHLDKILHCVAVAKGADAAHTITQLAIKVILYMHTCEYDQSDDFIVSIKQNKKSDNIALMYLWFFV